MKRMWSQGLVVAACLTAGPVRADLLTYEMVTVGNPGNAAEFNPFPTPKLYGAVAYTYGIGKYDVTIGQYAAFLNAVASVSDPYDLWNPSMGTDRNVAGISRGGSPGNYVYSVMNNGGDSANRPITYVSWFDAARFANWMSNGQGSGSTETGAYTLVAGQTSGVAPRRNPGAAFALPTENEWYKAAYYSPTLNSGSGGYYAFATQSNTTPGNNPLVPSSNQANWKSSAGFSVTQSPTYDANQNYLTDVGAFTASASYYGTFDQSGNVFQWNDLDGRPGTSRGLRGGSWENDQEFYLSSSGGGPGAADMEGPKFGFRLVSAVPEIDPSGMASVIAWVAAAFGLLERRRSAGA